MKRKILVLFTCFNRREKTENCIRTLADGSPACSFTFIAVDAGSTDGTREMLEKMKSRYDIRILDGNGLYYSEGMHLGMEHALDRELSGYDYILLVNDDVSFFGGCIEKMADQSQGQGNAVIAGAACSADGKTSYSAVKYEKGVRYRKIEPEEWELPADTFNANCVLIPRGIFCEAGPIDAHYRHSLGDFDYGLALRKRGRQIHVSREYIGQCEPNPAEGTWLDRSLSIRERIRRKESVKGAPTRQWFYFLRKNFGMLQAVKGCVTPYVRILMRM